MIVTGMVRISINDNIHIKEKIIQFSKETMHGEMLLYDKDNLFITCNRDHALQTGNNLLIGNMFNKTDYRAISADDLKNISFNDCEKVTNYYWGSYLLILNDIDNKKMKLLIDPVGQFPLFYYSHNEYILFSSDINSLNKLINKKISFNWDYLNRFLMNGNFNAGETPFEDIQEIPPGSIFEVSAKKISITTNWNPINYISSKHTTDYSLEFPKTLADVIKAWTIPFNTFCLDFSGGLESTSLALTLNKLLKEYPNKKLVGINSSHPMVNSSNELSHAKKIAAEIGMELIELNYENCLPFTPLENRKIMPSKPTILLSHEKYEHDLGKISNSYNMSLGLSGHGGDALFMCPPFISSIADYFIHKGLVGLKSKILDRSIYDRTPIYQVLKASVIAWLKYQFSIAGKAPIPQHYRAPWLTPSLLEATIKNTPSISNKKLLPGKKEHLNAIINTLASINVNIRNNETLVFYPFLHQPLLELALSIPTYLSLENGYDRSFFRKGINDYFQTQSVWRKEKGETSGVMQLGLLKNFTHVSELCMEGELARKKLINPNVLNTQLKLMKSGHLEYAWSLIHVFCLEKFLSYWN